MTSVTLTSSESHHSKTLAARSAKWLDELHKLADQRRVPVFSPVGDVASLASFCLDGYPYAAAVATAVEQVLQSAALV